MERKVETHPMMIVPSILTEVHFFGGKHALANT